MRIIAMELIKYDRLALSGIDHLRWVITSPLQLIIGSNSSGKTSVMEMTNPLPAKKEDFREGGGKKIWIEHQGKYYYLSSILSRSMVHSCVCLGDEFDPLDDESGEELNGSGISTVQSELAERIFGYTPWLHKLLTGKVKFTSSSTGMREEILAKVSDLDMRYAQGVYDKLKTTRRDLMGALKHCNTKRENQASALMVLGDLKSEIAESVVLESGLKELFPLTINTDPEVEGKRLSYNQAVSSLAGEIEACKKLAVAGDTLGHPDMDSVKSELDMTDKVIHTTDGFIKHRLNELAEIRKLKSRIEEGENACKHEDGTDGSSEDLEAVLTERKAKLVAMPCPVTATYEGELQGVVKELGQFVYGMQSRVNVSIGVESVCTREEYDASRVEYQSYNMALQENTSKLDTANGYITEYLALGKQAKECGSCGTLVQFDERGSEASVNRIRAKKRILEKEHDRIKASMSDLKKVGTARGEYMQYHTRIHLAMKEAYRLHPLWSMMDGGIEWCVTNHVAFLEKCRVEIRNLELVISYREVETSVKALEDTIALRKIAGDGKTAVREKKLSVELEGHYAARDTLLARRAKLTTVLSDYTAFANKMNTVEKGASMVATLFAAYTNAIAHTEVGNAVKQKQRRLSTIMSSVSERDIVGRNVQELTDEQRTLADRIKHVDKLMETLSPKHGLIGEKMSTFVDGFMEQVSAVISRVWSFPMEIGKCNMEEGGMTYVFPIVSASRVVKDVGKGSEGQKEIINFAFTLVLMQYMGLDDYPIYIDELGPTFDEVHKGKLIDYIIHMIDEREVSQMFMINHFSSFYGGLTHKETLVLSETNVVLPHVYNEGVTFK